MLSLYHKYYMNYSKAIFKNYPKDENALISQLGRQWKYNLVDLYKLASALKYFPRTRVRTIKLGTAGNFMLSMFGYPMKISRVLNMAMGIGMITTVSTAVRWGHGGNNRSRNFAVNGDVVRLVIEVYETKVLMNVHDTTDMPTCTTNHIKEKADCGIETCTGIRPAELLNISIDSERRDMRLCSVPDDVLLDALDRAYPQIGHYMEISESINSHYGVDSMFRVRVVPKIDRHGMQYVTFRLRASSPFCSVPKADKCEEEYQISREDILEEKFGVYSRYDVKSSIYRVTWALNNGRWPEEGVDFYEEIFGGSFDNQESRDNFKLLCQLVYFNGSDRKCLQSVKKAVMEDKLYLPEEYGDDTILSLIKDTRESMESVIGRTYGSEIFVHEGFIYMDVLDRLLRLGYDAVEVYDCFYVKGDRPELPALCHDLISECFDEYYRSYIK